ncbi:MAG: M1 family metallopeptidase [Terracidiphilus sp.]|nr:M1 family metallopeptidase [Terracidiphilus sp.]
MRLSISASLLRKTRAVAVVLAVLTAVSASAQRLSAAVHPEHYTLALTPDLKAATFTGAETIDIVLDQPSSAITLNAIEIAFQSVSIKAAGQEMKATITLDETKQQATFTFPEKVHAGKAQLSIQFKGILNNELRGFYLSKTAKRNYAVTQFESTDARRAFPCFDEPAFKATYDVSLTIDAADTAISNSLIESDTPGPSTGKHTLRFGTTPKMSTYLVAFLVGDFQCTSGSQDGVAIRVCSTPDKVAMTQFGLGEAEKILHYYNNYFGIPYPLKKLDLIGIPDFEAGAMENFGAITYRETALLIDPKTASVGSKKEVALVIAHEMAHQWFGDLVTMKWWDNLWLNEGFATWMENKPVAALHPDWNINQAIASGKDGTLNTDAQPTTRSIRAKAETPEEINQMFDGIAYGKAGAVLLSVENYIGPEVFRQGVHNYLAAHLYSNATAEDFWNAQTSASHKPVDKIMESLVAQPGVPILTFGEPVNGKVSVSQKRFFLSPSQSVDPAQKWTLPVCFKTKDGKQDCQILTPETTTLNVPAAPFFFANAGATGYYRSAYTPAAYQAIVATAETSLTPVERIGVVGDEWAQVRANKGTVGEYLDLLAALKSDPNAVVVDAALGDFGAIKWRIASSKAERDQLDGWLLAAFKPVYEKLPAPSPNDSPNTRELRASLFGLLGGNSSDPAIQAEAREIAAEYLDNPASVDPTLGQTALSVAVNKGDAALFDRLQKIFETSTNPEIQINALRLLVQFENPALLRRALDYAVSGKVRNQDAAVQFSIALQIPASREFAWQYIKDNWEKVKAQLTTEMGAILVSSTGSLCSADAHKDVEQFFSTHKVPSSDRSLRHALERIDGCIELRMLQEPNLKSWLAAQPK